MDRCVLQSYSGGSIGGAVKLNHGQADVVINWSGGLHHAKKAEVMGQLSRTMQLTKKGPLSVSTCFTVIVIMIILRYGCDTR